MLNALPSSAILRSFLVLGLASAWLGHVTGCDDAAPSSGNIDGGTGGSTVDQSGTGGVGQTGSTGGGAGAGGQGGTGGGAVTGSGGNLGSGCVGGASAPPTMSLDSCDPSWASLHSPDGPASGLLGPSGAELQITEEPTCQSFSGCKTLTVARDAGGALVWAALQDDPSRLAHFAELVGIPMTLVPICQISPEAVCWQNELRTYHYLSVQSSPAATLKPGDQAIVTAGGVSYAITFYGAHTVEGGVGCCLDAAGFWHGSVAIKIERQ